MAGALDQVLQEQVVGALFRLAQAHLRAVQCQALLLADIVVQAGAGRAGARSFAVAMDVPRRAELAVFAAELSAAGRTLRQPAWMASTLPTLRSRWSR